MNTGETNIWDFLVKNKYIQFQNFRSKNFDKIVVNLYQNNLNEVNSLVDDILFLDDLDAHYLVSFMENLATIINKSDRDEIINKLINKVINSNTYIENKWFVSHEKFCNNIIHLIRYMMNDYNLLNKFLLLCQLVIDIKRGIESNSHKAATQIMNECKINPLMLDDANFFRLCGQHNDNYFDVQYNEYKCLVDNLTCRVPIPTKLKSFIHEKESQHNKITTTDFRYESSPLFWHNNILYHGNRDIVYNSILFLKESSEYLDFKDVFTLSGSLDYYLINMYIESCYSGTINLIMVGPSDIMQFLRFIDQYPTESLSINKLELDIVDYFDNLLKDKTEDKINNNTFDSELEVMCEKYKLKCLYLFIHNEKIVQK